METSDVLAWDAFSSVYAPRPTVAESAIPVMEFVVTTLVVLAA